MGGIPLARTVFFFLPAPRGYSNRGRPAFLRAPGAAAVDLQPSDWRKARKARGAEPLVPIQSQPAEVLQNGFSASGVERSRSVSSSRRIKTPPVWRAKRKLKSAVGVATCREPVGLGAKRTRLFFHRFYFLPQNTKIEIPIPNNFQNPKCMTEILISKSNLWENLILDNWILLKFGACDWCLFNPSLLRLLYGRPAGRPYELRTSFNSTTA